MITYNELILKKKCLQDFEKFDRPALHLKIVFFSRNINSVIFERNFQNVCSMYIVHIFKSKIFKTKFPKITKNQFQKL